MADKLHDPRRDSSAARHPDGPLHDLDSQPEAGQNVHGVGPHPEKDNPRNAHDVKEAHRLLKEFHDDELRRIPILPAGAMLEAGATYFDLKDPIRGEFHGGHGERAGDGSLVVPKSEVDYPLWNRLISISDPARLDLQGADRVKQA